MARSVKVGDKVRVVNPIQSCGHYKKGDVLTVSFWCNEGIKTKESNTALLHREYELYEPIKVGDTVTLIDKPWETDVWKGMDRFYKKYFMKLKGIIWTVEKIRIGYFNSNYDCDDSQNGCPFIVPLGLLRKVDDGKKIEQTISTYAQHVVNLARDCFTKHPVIHRHTDEQIAEAQRIIGEIVAGFKFGQHFHPHGESDKELTIRYTAEPLDEFHNITAHCSPHDEFNRTIGLLVALCKATGRKLPDWV